MRRVLRIRPTYDEGMGTQFCSAGIDPRQECLIARLFDSIPSADLFDSQNLVGNNLRLLRPAALTLVLFALCASAAPALAQSADTLKNLSLEELASLDVTTVSKHSETVRESAAAVSVITGNDLRRAGITELAEALRLATGVAVA